MLNNAVALTVISSKSGSSVSVSFSCLLVSLDVYESVLYVLFSSWLFGHILTMSVTELVQHFQYSTQELYCTLLVEDGNAIMSSYTFYLNTLVYIFVYISSPSCALKKLQI